MGGHIACGRAMPLIISTFIIQACSIFHVLEHRAPPKADALIARHPGFCNP
jgi:hypothetical protein